MGNYQTNMIKKILHTLLRRRHFWRDANFDELTELYTSMIFRSVAVGSIGVFVPLYLHGLGYSLASILTLYGWFTTTMAVCGYGSAWLVARIGPKHVILISYAVQLVSSLLFLTFGMMHWPLWLLGGVWGLATNLFFVSYHVDFSKVKHGDHSGKEVGYMFIMQKVGLTIGPLMGGIVATLFGGQYVFLVACVLMAIGAAPLLKSGEPVRTHQRLDFSLPVSRIARDIRAYSALVVEDTLTKTLWPTYIVLFVLVGGAYLKLGLLASASVAFSIVVALVIGKLADARHGRILIRVSTAFNSIIHLIRPFVTSLPQTVAVNAANDTVTVGYTLPFIKGMYAAADDLPGYRIMYIATLETFGNIARAVTCWFLVLLAISYSDKMTLTIGFVIAAIASLVIASEKFRALGPRGL